MKTLIHTHHQANCAHKYLTSWGSEWLGEDEHGVGHSKVFEICDDCGKLFSYIIGEDNSIRYSDNHPKG